MVGVDLGTRIVKVNMSKIRKDHNPVEEVDVPLHPAALASADNTANSAAIAAKDACTTISKTTCRTDDFANSVMQHDASLVGSERIQCGQYACEPLTKGKIDFLEMFSGFCKAQSMRIHAGTSSRSTNRFENRLRFANSRRPAKNHGSHRATATKDHSHGTSVWFMEPTTKYQRSCRYLSEEERVSSNG